MHGTPYRRCPFTVSLNLSAELGPNVLVSPPTPTPRAVPCHTKVIEPPRHRSRVLVLIHLLLVLFLLLLSHHRRHKGPNAGPPAQCFPRAIVLVLFIAFLPTTTTFIWIATSTTCTIIPPA